MESDRVLTLDEIQEGIEALERRFASLAKEHDWASEERRLFELQREMQRRRERDQQDLEERRRRYASDVPSSERTNPFDGRARTLRHEVTEAVEEIERDCHVEARRRQRTSRYYTDRSRSHARAFGHVAEQIQSGVGGPWASKSAAVYGGVLTGRSVDQVVAYARAAWSEGHGGLADEAAFLAAALLSGLEAEAASDICRELQSALRRTTIHDGPVIGALLGRRSPEEALRFADHFTGRLGRLDPGPRALLLSAGLLSGEEAETAAQAVEQLLAKLPEEPMVQARIAAAALLSRQTPEDAVACAREVGSGLHGAPEDDARLTAAGMLAGRGAWEVVAITRDMSAHGASHGAVVFEPAVMAAAILSKQPAGESAACAQHLHHELTGGWESAAMVLAAALLQHPRAGPREHVAFALPGLFLS